MDPEHTLLGRLIVIEKMIEINNFDACLDQIGYLRPLFNKFTNAALGNEIRKDIINIEILTTQKKDEKKIMKDIDKKVKHLISVFLKYGIK